MMTKRFYINAYAVTRHYGGPEEGGWWYNAGEPLASVPIQAERLEVCPTFVDEDGFRRCRCYFAGNRVVSIEQHCEACESETEHDKCPPPQHWQFPREKVNKLLDDLHAEFADVVDGDIYSVRGGVALELRCEDQVAAHWPQQRPHYE